MKLAVVSDTHDRKENILKAVSIINENNVDVLIHCGDYVAGFVKDWFNKLNENIKNHNFYLSILYSEYFTLNAFKPIIW